MTDKRYFKRMWEEEFYIFDSETISENEFDEKVEYEDYQAFADSMMGDEVVDLLNDQNKIIRALGVGVAKIKKAIETDREAHALILCLEILKTLEEEGYHG